MNEKEERMKESKDDEDTKKSNMQWWVFFPPSSFLPSSPLVLLFPSFSSFTLNNTLCATLVS